MADYQGGEAQVEQQQTYDQGEYGQQQGGYNDGYQEESYGAQDQQGAFDENTGIYDPNGPGLGIYDPNASTAEQPPDQGYEANAGNNNNMNTAPQNNPNTPQNNNK